MSGLGDRLSAWRRRHQAARFAARFDSDRANAGDWAALNAWLEADDRNGAALDALGGLEGLPNEPSRTMARGGPHGAATAPRFSWLLPTLGGAMACIGLALLVVPAARRVHAPIARPDAPMSFVSGEHSRQIILPDASRVWLNRRSRMTARFDQASRDVALAPGSEAAFDVAHASGRPFTIKVADRKVTVLGTAFDIASQGDRLVVAVSRGIVKVSRPDGSSPLRLLPGQQFQHRIGAASQRVEPVVPAQVGSWRDGRLVYDDAPLQTVADDLSRYFDRPLTLAASARPLRFTGVLTIDSQTSILRRLELFLPVSAHTQADRIILSTRAIY